jgi:hypothetical protein
MRLANGIAGRDLSTLGGSCRATASRSPPATAWRWTWRTRSTSPPPPRRRRRPSCSAVARAASATGTRHPKLIQAVQLMEARIEEPLSQAALARRVGLSRRQVERLFRRHLGCTRPSATCGSASSAPAACSTRPTCRSSPSPAPRASSRPRTSRPATARRSAGRRAWSGCRRRERTSRRARRPARRGKPPRPDRPGVRPIFGSNSYNSKLGFLVILVTIYACTVAPSLGFEFICGRRSRRWNRCCSRR